MKTHPKTDLWFEKNDKWRDEMLALREILLASPLSEDFKWNGPCYTFEGSNVIALWGLKNAAAMAFFKGALMQDPENVLVAPGDNSRSMRKIEVQSIDEITALTPVLRDYILRAVAIEKAGLKVERSDGSDLEYPQELLDRLDNDTNFRAAFEALTPGRQRGYILHFGQAKQPATRTSRIEKAVPAIMAGKGMHDR